VLGVTTATRRRVQQNDHDKPAPKITGASRF
jgi:hypothetical protein